jgi:hypothetical protein
MFCEHRPYPGAGYHCYLFRGHDGPHSDLTAQGNYGGHVWDDDGRACTADGTAI